MVLSIDLSIDCGNGFELCHAPIKGEYMNKARRVLDMLMLHHVVPETNLVGENYDPM